MKEQHYFAENEREFLLYQKRLDVERVENTWKSEIQRLTAEVEQERQEKEQAKRREEQERQEKERLLTLLKQAGIDPNQ